MAIKVTIERSRWSRGGINSPTLMLNDSGAMCCLGFLARACGYEEHEIHQCGTPGTVMMFSTRALFPTEIIGSNAEPTTLHCELISANDNGCLTPREREARITELMARAGVEVGFVD